MLQIRISLVVCRVDNQLSVVPSAGNPNQTKLSTPFSLITKERWRDCCIYSTWSDAESFIANRGTLKRTSRFWNHLSLAHLSPLGVHSSKVRKGKGKRNVLRSMRDRMHLSIQVSMQLNMGKCSSFPISVLNPLNK